MTIPNTVTSIEYPGFCRCDGPLSVSIPNSVTTIGRRAFSQCEGLIVYHGTATGSPWGANSMNGIIEDGFVYSDSTRTTLLAYIGSSDSVTIPNTVTSIGHNAFQYCADITALTMPNSVTIIGGSAFTHCTSLTSVTIPNLVSQIGGSAFRNCSALTRVCYEADSCLTMLAPFSSDDTNITQLVIVIGRNVRWIPEHAFDFRGSWSMSVSSIVSKSMDAPRLGTDSTMGVAEVLEEPTCANGSSATIAATANYGYHFMAWSDGDIANPRTIALTGNTVLTALFERNEYLLTVVCDSTQGTVTGAGAYLFGDTAQVEAVANEGFVFSHWTETGGTEPALDTVMNEDIVLTAIFVEAVGIATVGESLVAMYPNPTTGVPNIEGERVQFAEVYDLSGRMVLRSEQTNTLDLGQLSTGVYYVRAACQQGASISKVVKK